MCVLPQERKRSAEWSANQLQEFQLSEHGAIDILNCREIHSCIPLFKCAPKVPMVCGCSSGSMEVQHERPHPREISLYSLAQLQIPVEDHKYRTEGNEEEIG